MLDFYGALKSKLFEVQQNDSTLRQSTLQNHKVPDRTRSFPKCFTRSSDVCCSLLQGRMWWCFGCYFCLPILFTILCQMATRNVNSDSSSTQKQRSHDDRSTNQKHQQHQALERQLNCTLLALAVVYGVCALPEHVCNITLAYANISISEETASMLALLHHFLLFFKSSVTPVLLLCLCKVGQAVQNKVLLTLTGPFWSSSTRTDHTQL